MMIPQVLEVGGQVQRSGGVRVRHCWSYPFRSDL